MALQNFNPIPNQTTHADATNLLNNNFTEAENRINSLETINAQTLVTSVSNIATFDASSNKAFSITMTEDTDLVITGANTGDSGIIVVRQSSPANYTVSANSTNHAVLGGSFSSFQFITPDTGVATVSWYYDGSEYFLYVSDAV